MEQIKERLQKVMAAAGVASRRECEKIILAGRVQVNGKTVTELGTRVGKADRIMVDGKRLYPVGRLDYQTEGLLLMTNDGELAQHLTHPSHHVDKTYEVEVHGRVPEEKLDVLRLGVPLEDGLTSPAVVYVKQWDPEKNLTRFTVTIHEGRNRQVRRMCDFIGFPVKSLKRIQVGPLTLEGLKKGEFRELTPEEIASLDGQGE